MFVLFACLVLICHRYAAVNVIKYTNDFSCNIIRHRTFSYPFIASDLAIQIQLHRRLGDLDPTTGKSVVPPTSKLKVHEKKIVVLELAARRRELHGEVSNIEVEMGGSVASADKAEDAMVRILQVSGVLRC
jgi:hypothetical protein